MNLQNLFKTQKLLDNRIVDEHNLHGQDLLPQKILALQVELGELANELPEIFKFWSNKKNDYEKALGEFVDGLHFILSIGNDLDSEIDKFNMVECIKFESIIEQFIETFKFILWVEYEKDNVDHYYELLETYLGLGEMLGFTPEQIEQAYYAKNKINHTRQDNKY